MLLDKIRALCAERKVGIADLEASALLGKNTVYRWDRAYPSADKLKRVADYFGVTVDELLKDDSESQAG